MNELEWLTCMNPQEMVKSLPGNASERKLRLFACACCRRILHLLPDERSRKAVEVAERFLDGSSTLEAVNESAGGAYLNDRARISCTATAGETME